MIKQVYIDQTLIGTTWEYFQWKDTLHIAKL